MIFIKLIFRNKNEKACVCKCMICKKNSLKNNIKTNDVLTSEKPSELMNQKSMPPCPKRS